MSARIKKDDLTRLNRMADRIEKNDRYFQDLYGDPEPGSVRASTRRDAEAIRRVVAWISERAG